MASYYLDQNQRKSYNRRQKIRRFITAIVLLALIIGVIWGIWKNLDSSSAKPVVVKPLTKSYYAGTPKRVFQTDRFSFESTSDWQISQEESLAPAKYVFFTHSLNNNLIEYELDVLFNKSLDGRAFNYVMPVTIQANKLKADVLSERCGDAIVAQKGNSSPNTLSMQFHGANYLCDVKGSGEKAVVSLVGGSYDLPMTTPKGQPVVVNISFLNNSSSFFGTTLKEVLDSFSLK